MSNLVADRYGHRCPACGQHDTDLMRDACWVCDYATASAKDLQDESDESEERHHE